MNKNLILKHEEIMKKVSEIAKYLDEKYVDKKPVVIGIMKGSLYFLSDLTKMMEIEIEIDVMNLSSYGDSSKSLGTVKIKKDIDIDIDGRYVIVLEDIVDTGKTLEYLKKYFIDKNAKNVETISIFKKMKSNVTSIDADIIGFELPNAFLVGYGLDYAQRYRNLCDVYELTDL